MRGGRLFKILCLALTGEEDAIPVEWLEYQKFQGETMGRAAKRKTQVRLKAQVRKHLLDVPPQESFSSAQDVVTYMALVSSAQILKVNSTTERGFVLAGYVPGNDTLTLKFEALDFLPEFPQDPKVSRLVDLVNQYDPKKEVVFGYFANDSTKSFFCFKLPIKLLMATALILEAKRA